MKKQLVDVSGFPQLEIPKPIDAKHQWGKQLWVYLSVYPRSYDLESYSTLCLQILGGYTAALCDQLLRTFTWRCKWFCLKEEHIQWNKNLISQLLYILWECLLNKMHFKMIIIVDIWSRNQFHCYHCQTKIHILSEYVTKYCFFSIIMRCLISGLIRWCPQISMTPVYNNIQARDKITH